MVGVTALRKIQLGRESTAGTPVAASTILWSKGMLEDAREQKSRDAHIGYLGKVDNSYVPKLFGKLAQEESEASFEQILHVLEAGVHTDTPAQDGSGTDYIYEYVAATTAQKTPKTYTIENGDDAGAERMEYGVVEKFVLSGEAGDAVKITADWFGRQVVPNAFTGAIAVPDVEVILFPKGKIYMDAVGGTIGSTQLTNTWLKFSLDWKTGFLPVFTGDGNKYFSLIKQAAPEIMLDLQFEHETQSIAQKALWKAETPRQIRMKFEGAAIGTPGSVYSVKTVLIDLAGRYTKFEKIGEKDGNDIIDATFEAGYNATAALFAEITVVNELSAVQ